MKCPVCKDVNLTMADRQGIEIDYCPQCRGVWLDRGELDKIIERTADTAPPQAAAPPPPPPQAPHHAPPAYESRPREYRDSDRHDYYDPRKKKRKSLLKELFDF